MRDSHLLKRCILPLSLHIWLAATADKRPTVASDAIGFVETFALADDREKALEELAPGTEEYYFYHALHYQNSNQIE
ncbi:MAG: hypothetical protein AAF961_03840, partial [Planctomycetota bacterium]